MTATREYTSETLNSSAGTFVFNIYDSGDLLFHEVDSSRYTQVERYLLDAMGAAAWETGESSFAYRIIGEDSLSSGNIGSWIQLAWSRSAFRAIPRRSLFRKYSTFVKILGLSRIYQVNERYVLRQPEKVRDYLLNNSQLIEILVEGRSVITNIFGDEADVALEVVTDPELENHKQLYAYIITSKSVDEALMGLESLDDEWFLEKVDMVGESFNFNLEIV